MPPLEWQQRQTDRHTQTHTATTLTCTAHALLGLIIILCLLNSIVTCLFAFKNIRLLSKRKKEESTLPPTYTYIHVFPDLPADDSQETLTGTSLQPLVTDEGIEKAEESAVPSQKLCPLHPLHIAGHCTQCHAPHCQSSRLLEYMYIRIYIYYYYFN